MIAGYFTAAGVTALVFREPIRRRRHLTKVVSVACKVGLTILGVEVQTKGQKNKKTNHLIVANHLSYLDILVHSSQSPSCFVTSMEIKETPVLGQICSLAACLFVERRNKENLRKEISELTESLEAGIDVTIFPEATSTNGEQLLRFRRPLFAAAIFADKPVQPICLNYFTPDMNRLTLKNRDDVCWYGDMDFVPHLWRLVGHRNLIAELNYLEELAPTSAEDLTQTSFEKINATFLPVINEHSQAANETSTRAADPMPPVLSSSTSRS